jgi:hypothetical protein
MSDMPYDQGYAVIKKCWGLAFINLQLGWVDQQLQAHPEDQFRWGRQDALHDMLMRFDQEEIKQFWRESILTNRAICLLVDR